MIVGIGTDLVDIRRISQLSFGREKFLIHNYTMLELEYISKQGSQQEDCCIAMLFAAKEACSKAIGTGFTNGVYPKKIEVIHCNTTNKPHIVLHDSAWQYLINLIKPTLHFCIHITLVSEYPMAGATVIIEKL